MPIIEYVTILHLFYVLFLFNPEVYEILAPHLGSCTTCIGRPSLNPWTSREVPQLFISISISSWIFYYTLSYNPILINYVALIVLYLETASAFSCLTCPFDISNMIFFFVEHFLNFGHYKKFHVHLIYLLCQLGTTGSPGGLLESSIRNQVLCARCYFILIC